MLIGHFSFLVHLEATECECRLGLTSSKLFHWEQKGAAAAANLMGELLGASTWVPNCWSAFSLSVRNICFPACATRPAAGNESFWLDVSSLLQTTPATQLCCHMAKWILHWKHPDWKKHHGMFFRKTSGVGQGGSWADRLFL